MAEDFVNYWILWQIEESCSVQQNFKGTLPSQESAYCVLYLQFHLWRTCFSYCISQQEGQRGTHSCLHRVAWNVKSESEVLALFTMDPPLTRRTRMQRESHEHMPIRRESDDELTLENTCIMLGTC